MRRFIIPLAWLAAAMVGILVSHFVFHVGWAMSLGGITIGLAAVFVNGLLATWEDEQPGGFDNPTPKQTQKDSQHDNAA